MPFTKTQPKALPSARSISAPVTAEKAGTVLLVEDEPAISRMLVRLFDRAGLRVVAAVDAAEGLALLARNPREIALAFVDCHGTDVDQREFCRRVRSILPFLPMMLAAGHDRPADDSATTDNGLTVVIPRPYLPTELVWKARAMLGRATG